jgi:hypothetical protein
MAQTEHLPIYKRSYDLCLYFEQIVKNFSRYHKYSLGSDLREGARRVLKLIVRANSRRDKTAVLLDLREELEELKVLLRLCLPRYAPRGTALLGMVGSFRALRVARSAYRGVEHAIACVTEIAKQNEGWLKSQQQGRGPTGAGQNRPAMPDRLAEPSVP